MGRYISGTLTNCHCDKSRERESYKIPRKFSPLINNSQQHS